MNRSREPGLIRRGVYWLLLLGPLFFLSYGLANNHTAGRSDVGSLVFGWESRMPLWPWTIIPYWSIDLLYGLSFLLPRTRQEMDRHALALLTAQLISVSCFLLWPLRFTFERPELGGVFGWMFDVLMGFDKPFNQAPSLHIALLVIIWTMFARHVRRQPWRCLMHGWMALIGVSVLTTWQHHFVDVPTGALAGFVCVSLWPHQGPLPWQQVRLARDAKRWRLALFYTMAGLLCAVPAVALGGAWLWLTWPAVSLALVALNYAVLGAGGFQKGADGRLSNAASWLLAPYLVGAWVNSRLWTWRRPQADEVCDGVYLGRIPGRDAQFAAVVDLCAELPCHVQDSADNCRSGLVSRKGCEAAPGFQLRSRYCWVRFAALSRHKAAPTGYASAGQAAHGYACFPTLDLIAPESPLLHQAAVAIERLRSQGPVLVCCALGYSRSASAVAAWLVLTGRCSDARQAEALIRKARPGVVLHSAHRQALQQLEAQA
ncbi:phosphatase PAP2/dual specificity phosphatase family protein [Pseudomonas sp. Kh13]|uniref:phosphatase PAP2/dual specificity phosphatase family protein n=1 Tax=Pseudomonas sp. Kh13 TaxID=2093744 RepID=UPI0011842CB5|nr:phosphatase PAP2/dual specificity phosphatase family protein [Pseudomonas sp. Kh13]